MLHVELLEDFSVGGGADLDDAVDEGEGVAEIPRVETHLGQTEGGQTIVVSFGVNRFLQLVGLILQIAFNSCYCR